MYGTGVGARVARAEPTGIASTTSSVASPETKAADRPRRADLRPTTSIARYITAPTARSPQRTVPIYGTRTRRLEIRQLARPHFAPREPRIGWADNLTEDYARPYPDALMRSRRRRPPGPGSLNHDCRHPLVAVAIAGACGRAGAKQTSGRCAVTTRCRGTRRDRAMRRRLEGSRNSPLHDAHLFRCMG